MPGGYPWSQGDLLLAHDLNAAIANSVALGGGVLPLTGGTMTGPLTLAGNATLPMHAVPLQQINTAAAGGPFLPISGGTVTGNTSVNARLTAAMHMTSPNQDGNVTIDSTVLGGNINGPANAQFGLFVNHIKDGWYTGTATSGEIDGINVYVRQGGTGTGDAAADGGGMLINIAGTGNGFLCISECVVQHQAINTGVPDFGIRTQEGGMYPPSNGRIGKWLLADYGNLTSAISVANTVGRGYWTNILQNARDNVLNFNITDAGMITVGGANFTLPLTAGAGEIFLRGDNQLGLRWNSGNNRFEFEVSGTAQIGIGTSGDVHATTLATAGAITATGAVNANGGIAFSGGSFVAGNIYNDASWGCLIYGHSGTQADVALFDSAGNPRLKVSTTGIGFQGTAGIAKPTVSGAKGGNAALGSLMAALAAYGLVTDTTT